MDYRYFKILFINLFNYLIYFIFYIPISNGYTCEPGTGEVLVRSTSDSTISSSSEQPVYHNNEQSSQFNSDFDDLVTSSKWGHFYSPNWPDSYITGTRCVYRFIANVGEKVRIRFNQFSLAGQMPSCSIDFLDIYIDVASSSLDLDRQTALLTSVSSGEQQTTTPFSAAIYSSVLDKSDLLGRYCDNYLKIHSVEFISLHREIVIDFYAESDRNEHNELKFNSNRFYGFNGTFEFINDDAYYPGRAVSTTELPIPVYDVSSIPCRFQIKAEQLIRNNNLKPNEDDISGELISPTYPGFHPDGLVCAYQLIGLPLQRINIDILDINLQPNSVGCPQDYLQFYDGFQFDNLTSSSYVIGKKFCTQSNTNLRIVSSTSNLLILFVTGIITLQQQEFFKNHHDDFDFHNRRGFHLRYTFSKRYLPIVQLPGAQHIRGTECDYIVMKQDLNEMQLESPTNRNELNLTANRYCNFVFMGSKNDQFMETVSLGFEQIELPKSSEGNEICDHGFLAIYGSRNLIENLQLNEPVDEYSDNVNRINVNPDFIICDHNIDNKDNKLEQIKINSQLNQYPIMAKNNLLILRFNSTGADLIHGMNMKFILKYQFKKDFGIPGKLLNPNSCHYVYNYSAMINLQTSSTNPMKGWTNSPLYPNFYPSNLECLYIFTNHPKHNHDKQTISIQFDNFMIDSSNEELEKNSWSIKNFQTCQQDFLEIVQLYTILNPDLLDALTTRVNYPTQLEISQEKWIERWHNLEKELQIYLGTNQHILEPINIYCGNHIPGPIATDSIVTAVLIRFHSGKNVNSKGFSLSYEFLPNVILNSASSLNQLMELNAKTDSTQNDSSGLIITKNYPNNYPNNYIYEWILYGKSVDSQIQLHFMEFNLEDCFKSVVRIYEGHNPRNLYEICGNQSKLLPIIVKSHVARVRFHSSSKSNGAKGFELIWTNLLNTDPQIECLEFRCEHTKYCISSQLQCNDMINCGTYESNGQFVIDDSDETVNCSYTINYNLAHIGTGVLVALILLSIIACFIYYREYRRKKTTTLDPLSELTGSKHSLAHLQSNNHKIYSHKSKRLKLENNSNRHSQQQLKHDIQTSELLRELTHENDINYVETELLKKNQQTHHHLHHLHHHHHHHHHLPNQNHHRKQIPQGHSHLSVRDCHMSHYLLNNVHNHGSTTGRLQKKNLRVTSQTGSLSRNGGTISDSVHSISGTVAESIIGGSGGTNLTSGVDGGLLIREKMQKISIV